MDLGSLRTLIDLTPLTTGDLIALFNTGLTAYIAYLALRFTAKPRIAIELLGKRQFEPAEVVRLQFGIENTGWYFGNPAAENVRLFVNFEPAFEPFRLLFGSSLERVNTTVRKGVDSKYLVADEIHLYANEPGERVAVDVEMPDSAGRYKCWIAASSDSGSLGVHEFHVRVSPGGSE